jgi:hypothetical protein
MTFTHHIGEESARPVVWLFEGAVEHNGKTYSFWYEYDERDGDVNYEFEVEEPDDDFDFDEFAAYCQAQVEKAWNKGATV